MASKLKWTQYKQPNGAEAYAATYEPLKAGAVVVAVVKYTPGANIPWSWHTPGDEGRKPRALSLSKAKKFAALALKREAQQLREAMVAVRRALPPDIRELVDRLLT